MVVQCPVDTSQRPVLRRTVDPAEAEAFVRIVHDELPELGPAAARVAGGGFRGVTG